jgi:signal transduction histidine kinase
MQSLLNDLLELSRIGRIMNLPEDVSFEEVVNEAIERVRGRLDTKKAQIRIQSDLPIVYGDRVRLVEVIQNLMDNSAKYANPQSTPCIEIGVKKSDQQRTTFFVRDNGIGIDPQFHERIFGLFNKLDTQAEGTGVGLTLVRRIIEVHGGHIWVESELGQGATFYFTLPNSLRKE